MRLLRFEDADLGAPVVDVAVLPRRLVSAKRRLQSVLPRQCRRGETHLVERCRDGVVVAVGGDVLDPVPRSHRSHEAFHSVTTPRGKYRRAIASLATEQALCT